MSGYSTAHCSIGQIVCECLWGFFPPPSLLVKGVGQTQKRLLEMIVSREAALVLIEEAKRDERTVERTGFVFVERPLF